MIASSNFRKVQLIDIYESAGKSVLTLWDGYAKERMTFMLTNKQDLEPGLTFEYNVQAQGEMPALQAAEFEGALQDFFPLPMKQGFLTNPIPANKIENVF